MSQPLPARPSLEHLKKQARERLSLLRLHMPGARLADAQRAVARAYGFTNWCELKVHVAAARAASAKPSPASGSRRPVEPGSGSRPGPARAFAIDLRDDSDAPFGVALLVPAARHAALLLDDSAEASELKLRATVWRGIDRWIVAGNSGLPARPAPLGPTIVAALLDSDRAVGGHRLGAFPFRIRGRRVLTASVKRLLPRLRDAWQRPGPQ